MGRDRLWACGTALLLSSSAAGQVTLRANLASDGAESNGFCAICSISADGRFVAFDGSATNLVPGDTNGNADVFVRDRQYGTTELASVASDGSQGNGASQWASISADGRYVAFESVATNLVAGDTNGVVDVFVHDRVSGATERLSLGAGGSQGNGESRMPVLSADGRFVGFRSVATNLVPNDTNAVQDLFLCDRASGTIERVSLATGGAQANGRSYAMSITPDGRYVAFDSEATNLVPGDTNGTYDIFLRDRLNATTELVSLNSLGVQAGGTSSDPTLSGDGRYVSFGSTAPNLVPADTNGCSDVFLRDRQNSTTERVSVDAGGGQGAGPSFAGSMSPDARFVAFTSYSTFAPGDTNGTTDVFLRDHSNGAIERVNLSTAGAEALRGESWGGVLSSDGRVVAFRSFASNLVAGDTNGFPDVFVRERLAPGCAVLCEPGVAGTLACPCSNPPSGAGRGCDNASATGGALLSASGHAFLGADSLGFTTSGENPSALSIVVQGDSLIPGGVLFGQGLRCVGGDLRRLYVKDAAGGSITAPDAGAGEPSVSSRSAAAGAPIPAGAARGYMVYYRESSSLGGCPATSLFNGTQALALSWWY